MSCNGCRILRKGCSENCILRQSLRGIDSPQAQANATVFVAKFFGRAGLMSFLSSVPESQRPALFQSLLFEACGRTVNPVNGAVGLLWTGNWHMCQAAVETVLSGGALKALPEFVGEDSSPDLDGAPESNGLRLFRLQEMTNFGDVANDLNLGLTADLPARMTADGGRVKRRAATPSEESETTTLESGFVYHHHHQQNSQRDGEAKTKLLRLFF